MGHSSYTVIARAFRPQRFSEVVGQNAVVQTLKNAIQFNRLAHAYLFSGARGTGKTTLARLFAKAINCSQRNDDGEPCNQCASCLAFQTGSFLDFLEIDGASNRGIEDIRQINENVSYVPSVGKFKVYLIDEVHMLTKEAFNALLKTLEEPPPNVKFFFATTEPNKIPLTVLSRCQRFFLQKIPHPLIISNLQSVAHALHVDIEPKALSLIAWRGEGSLRDAQSLLDQMIAHHQGPITAESVRQALGYTSQEFLFHLDRILHEGSFKGILRLVQKLFEQGCDCALFLEELTSHFRLLLLAQLSPASLDEAGCDAREQQHYLHMNALYTQEQYVLVIELLLAAQQQIRHTLSPRIFLEMTLIKVLQTKSRITIEHLISRLEALEGKSVQIAPISTPEPPAPTHQSPQDFLSEQLTPKQAPSSSAQTASTSVRTASSRPIDPETLLQFAAVELGGKIERSPQQGR